MRSVTDFIILFASVLANTMNENRDKDLKECSEIALAHSRYVYNTYLLELYPEKRNPVVSRKSTIEQTMLDVHAFIKSAGNLGVSRTDITRRFRKYNPREMDSMLESILLGGDIVCKKIDPAGSKGRAALKFYYNEGILV